MSHHVSVGTVDVAERMLALRKTLGLTQEQLAAKIAAKMPPSEAPWTRPSIANIENGKNQLGSYDARKYIADGIGVGIVEMAAYIEGSIDVAALVARIDQPVRTYEPGENRAYPVSALGNRPEWPELKRQLLAGRKRVNEHLVEEVAHMQFSNAPQQVLLEFVFKQYEAAIALYGEDYAGPPSAKAKRKT